MCLGFHLCFFAIFQLQSTSSRAEYGSIVDLGLAGDFYFTEKSANNGQGFVNLLIQNTWSDSQLWVDVGAGGLVGDTASSYVKAPQLFYRQGQRNESHFIIGRALHDWSFADEFWNMGITQPIFKWNDARPEQQGLVGFFVTHPIVKNKFEMTAFTSPLFLPSQGPSYELINGQITSSNPWFTEPVQVLDLSGTAVDLNFDIEIPKTQEIIFQPSFGLQFSTPPNKKDGILNLFGMNKPRNDLVLPFEGLLNLTTLNGDIVIKPVVPRHTIAGVDVGWNFNDFKTIFSWMYESEINYDPPVGTTYPIIPEQNIFSFNQLFRVTDSQRFWISYIKVDRQANQVGGTNSGAQISAFLNRNRFEEALRLKWEGLLFKTQSLYRVNASLAYNQSLVRDNVWVSADVRWSIYRGIEAFTQCDLFGGSEEQIEAVDFMSAHQNNDRCLVGGHYAF